MPFIWVRVKWLRCAAHEIFSNMTLPSKFVSTARDHDVHVEVVVSAYQELVRDVEKICIQSGGMHSAVNEAMKIGASAVSLPTNVVSAINDAFTAVGERFEIKVIDASYLPNQYELLKVIILLTVLLPISVNSLVMCARSVMMQRRARSL